MIGGNFFGASCTASGNDYDDSRAPWNDSRDEQICPKCEGDGRWYVGHRRERITEAQYNALPQNKRDDYALAICPMCDGEGFIYE